eukprot:scaffold3425_cov107-Isochrysis_galbana.AAC.2
MATASMPLSRRSAVSRSRTASSHPRHPRQPRPRSVLCRAVALAQQHALVHLDHLVVQHTRAADPQVEDVGPRLRPDVQRVPEALGHQQRRLGAIALEQRVGGHSRAHPDPSDERRVERDAARVRNARRRLQDPADALAGRVGVVGRVDRQQLDAARRSLPGAECVHVGEGATAVDGEAEAPRPRRRGRTGLALRHRRCEGHELSRCRDVQNREPTNLGTLCYGCSASGFLAVADDGVSSDTLS